MRVTGNLEEVRQIRWSNRKESWGLVPTMGALHRGHKSLLKKARTENDKIGVSIFINPIQFNNKEDLLSYPRSIDQDLKILEEENVDLVWIPDPKDIYTENYQSFVEVSEISLPLEGASRPGHFRGVTTIVTILFNVFQPDRAYFGQKDAQQLLVIRQMVKDLQFNLDIISCPTIRESDGLAISSRNQNLSIRGREQANCLFEALSGAKNEIVRGEKNANHIKNLMKEVIEMHDLARIDYISVADTEMLQEIQEIQNSCLISLAVIIEQVRLIDNILIEI